MQTAGRSPYGERGLKYCGFHLFFRLAGRSPYGERGLKYDVLDGELVGFGSLSLRRAWIEMIGGLCVSLKYAVALLTESVD